MNIHSSPPPRVLFRARWTSLGPSLLLPRPLLAPPWSASWALSRCPPASLCLLSSSSAPSAPFFFVRALHLEPPYGVFPIKHNVFLTISFSPRRVLTTPLAPKRSPKRSPGGRQRPPGTKNGLPELPRGATSSRTTPARRGPRPFKNPKNELHNRAVPALLLLREPLFSLGESIKKPERRGPESRRRKTPPKSLLSLLFLPQSTVRASLWAS